MQSTIIQLAELKKHHARLRHLVDARASEIDATLKRLNDFHNGLLATTSKINGLVDNMMSEMSQPLTGDVPSIQHSQQQFVVRYCYILYLIFTFHNSCEIR